MEAGPDASIGDLFSKGGHVGPAVDYAGRCWTGHGDLGDVCRSKHRVDDTSNGAAQDAMRARVLRVQRRVVERLPSGLTIGIRVAVNVAVANCRDWPPEIVMVLGVEHSDQRIVEANRHERHEPRAVADTHLLCGHELAYERVISLWAGHEPELGSFGLLSRSLATGLSAVVFEVIEVSRPFLARRDGLLRERPAAILQPVSAHQSDSIHHLPRAHARQTTSGKGTPPAIEASSKTRCAVRVIRDRRRGPGLPVNVRFAPKSDRSATLSRNDAKGQTRKSRSPGLISSSLMKRRARADVPNLRGRIA
jgi:hypothetical protein